MSDKAYVDAELEFCIPIRVKASFILRDSEEGTVEERLKAHFKNKAAPGEVEQVEVEIVQVGQLADFVTRSQNYGLDAMLEEAVQESLVDGITAVTVRSTEVTDAK